MQRAEQPLTQVPLVARYRANQRPPATAMLRGRARDQLLLQPGHSHHAASAKPARRSKLTLELKTLKTKQAPTPAERAAVVWPLPWARASIDISTHEGAGSLDAEGFR